MSVDNPGGNYTRSSVMVVASLAFIILSPDLILVVLDA